MRTYFTNLVVWLMFTTTAYNQCGITSTNPGSTLIFNNISVSSNTFIQRVIRIQGTTVFPEDMTFVNCEIYLDANFTYQNVINGPLPKFEFKNCKIFLHGIFRSIQGFNPAPSHFIFDGCCISNRDPNSNLPEILHLEAAGLKFVNNIVSISGEQAHMFHLKNMNLTLENAFYGNTVTYTIAPDLNGDGFIAIDQSVGTINIGDEYGARNIFNVTGNVIRDFNSNTNDKLVIVNSNFITKDIGLLIKKKMKGITINGCNFSGLNQKGIGLSINSSDAMNVQNCTFSSEAEAISVLNGVRVATISNNTFTSSKTGIKSSFANQSLNVGDISNNTFIGNTIDIHSTGAWLNLDIKNNNFSAQQYGILADGDNQYNVDNNSFFNSYASSILYSNGDNENRHTLNQINTIVGVHTLNENIHYKFIDNCFSTTGGDVYIDGSVNDEIGNLSREAGNCFTKQTIPDISATGSSFDYFRPNTKINTCSDPVTSGTYIKQHGAISPDLLCGSGVPFTGVIYNYCNFNINTITCAQSEILANQIQQQITFIKNSNAYNNPKQKAYLLKRLNLCRVRLLKLMLGCVDKAPHDPKLGDGSFNNPIDGIQAGIELRDSQNKYESAAFVGLSVELEMLTEASSYLASMPYIDEEMTDFKDVQLLNIQYRTLKDSFVLNQSQKSMLYSKAQKSQPLAAYARGLYYQLTGETIYPDIPMKTFSRSKTGADISISIYPNPVDDLMNVTHNNNTYQINIMDIAGRSMLNQAMEGGTSSFDTTTWQSGLYIVTLLEDDGHVSSYKLIKH